MKPQKVNRSAVTGRFVSAKFAKHHKRTTVRETIGKAKPKTDFGRVSKRKKARWAKEISAAGRDLVAWARAGKLRKKR